MSESTRWARANRPSTPAFKRGNPVIPRDAAKAQRTWRPTLEQVLKERVSVTENGKRKNITKLEAMLKQLANKAAAGDHRNLLALHPTVKPATLVADAITDCTSRRDIVLDGFLGSGSTVIAAERTGRRCYGMEIDPLYVDVTVRRWQGFTREPARHAITGKCFNEIEAAGGRR